MIGNVESGALPHGTLPLTISSGEESSIYDEDIHMLQRNLYFDVEWTCVFPEDSMIDNVKSSTMPVGTLPLTISSRAKPWTYGGDTQILQSQQCSDMEKLILIFQMTWWLRM
ncbi:unnamed protein product [Ilex paraguariensis]|uniref:Uncharacterized protein n=1 Tax=Ilex paraguariensis TaxID=185542 RepID=A0ABC8R9R8_9AQUA